MTKLDSHYSVDKAPYCQGYGLPSGHIWLWDLDHKEGGVPKNWCLRTLCWRRLLRVRPMDSKIKPVNLKENQPWILIGRTDAEAQTPVFWSSDVTYSGLIGKVPDAGKDSGQNEKRASEDEMAGWHHQCNPHELGQTLRDGEGQRGLKCCSPWSCKESDMTGRLNNHMYTWITLLYTRN